MFKFISFLIFQTIIMTNSVFATPQHLINMGVSPNLSHRDLYELKMALEEYETAKEGTNMLRSAALGIVVGTVTSGPIGFIAGIGAGMIDSFFAMSRLKDSINKAGNYLSNNGWIEKYLGKVYDVQISTGTHDRRETRFEPGSDQDRGNLVYEISKAINKY